MFGTTRFTILAVSAVLMAAPPPNSPTNPKPMSIEYIAAPSELSVAVMGCQDCKHVQCVEGKHASSVPAPPGLAFGPGDGTHSLCNSGSCLNVHGICGGFAQAIRGRYEVLAGAVDIRDALSIAVASQDADLIAELIRASSGRVELNKVRQAVQVIDCAGRYVANYSLTQAEWGSIVALVE